LYKTQVKYLIKEEAEIDYISFQSKVVFYYYHLFIIAVISTNNVPTNGNGSKKDFYLL